MLPSLLGYCSRSVDISEKAARELQGLRMIEGSLSENPWTNPPSDVVDGGFESVMGYWKAIERSGEIVSWKMKVVLVGAVKAGKTSLIKGMIHGQSYLCPNDDRTKGVDVSVDEPCKPDPTKELEIVFWDFAGHSEYWSTHQLFLSKGALNILVVDLKRFSDEPSTRAALVDVWLDALQCRVPGSNVFVVATQIDRCTSGIEADMADLQLRIKDHIRKQHDDLEQQVKSNRSTSSGAEKGLIFHGIEAVSSAYVDRLLDLRLKLCTLVYSNRDNFPSVGRRLPVSWVRVSAMLEAKRTGENPIIQVSCVGSVEENKEKPGAITPGDKILHRADAIQEWGRVVRTLELENEVGLTEPNSENLVFEVRGR